MEPIRWGNLVVEHLERAGVVGCLLPTGLVEPGDRYQPYRLFVEYLWSGPVSAGSLVTFKVRMPEDRQAFMIDRAGWIASSSSDAAGWGAEWENVTIRTPAGPAVQRAEEFHAPGRFHIRLSMHDEPVEGGLTRRRVLLQNLREIGGILYAVRICQTDLPPVHQLRPYGIDEDIYYRAGGLIGSLDQAKHELVFAPCALLPEPVRTPVRGPALREAVAGGALRPEVANLLSQRGIEYLWRFQVESIAEMRRWLAGDPRGEAILLTSGTAAGKTEAFLVPLLESLIQDQPALGVQGMFVYPTKALEADQAARFFEYLVGFNQGRAHPLSIGVLDGDTPFNREELARLEEQGEFRSPFSDCPSCGAKLRFTTSLDGRQLQTPECSGCLQTFPWLRVDRGAIRDYWPSLLLTVPDMLHRQLSNTFAFMSHSIFGRPVHVCDGCGKYTPATHKSLAGRRPCSCGRAFNAAMSLCPSLLVFDEAHLLKGLFGSQVGLLIARLKAITGSYGHRPVMVGASATIAAPEDFGCQLFGGRVHVLAGQEEIRRDQEPRRYHLFVMPVQVTVLHAVGHVLAGCFRADRLANERNRVLIFSDSKRTVFQLEASLPEFYSNLPEDVLPGGIVTAPTRSHTADHSPEERRRVELAFDRGELRVLLATQTLEVGVDFRNLQLEVQTGATYSYNDYIQRVGRAGRRGVPALVICVLRPQVPLDYYYFEHCRELVQFSQDTLDDLPLRTDNPFLVERHAPAAIQDYLIAAEPGARLVWDSRGAARLLQDAREPVEEYLRGVFLRPHSWDQDLIVAAAQRGVDRALSVLTSTTIPGTNSSERLGTIIELSIRATDISVDVDSEDFHLHRRISVAGELAEEELAEEVEGEANEDLGYEVPRD